jgi:NADH:ubiquinone oxidoreductase subunit 6 (subunit J)
MTFVTFIFYFFEAAAAISALGLALSRNVFYGALMLIVCLLALAGIYILAFAEFVAITQILIYAGGILVVIIFGIMLTTKILEKPLTVEHAYIGSGVLAAVAFFVLMGVVLAKESFYEPATTTTETTFNNVNVIGISLFSKYTLPFEIAGLLLLIALIGASVIASTIKSKNDNASS